MPRNAVVHPRSGRDARELRGASEESATSAARGRARGEGLYRLRPDYFNYRYDLPLLVRCYIRVRYTSRPSLSRSLTLDWSGSPEV
jgi:hypothetical protein